MADQRAAGGTGIREPTAIPVGLTSLGAGAAQGRERYRSQHGVPFMPCRRWVVSHTTPVSGLSARLVDLVVRPVNIVGVLGRLPCPGRSR